MDNEEHDMTDPMDVPPALAEAAAPYVSAPPKPRRRWIATAAVSVVAVAAGAFGVMVLSSGDGADSPEAAVDAFFNAIDHEDPIGVMEALDPEERQILRPALEDTSTEAKRVEVASQDLDLRNVKGIELQVHGLTYRTQPLAQGLVAIDLTGGYVDASADINEMPVGKTISDILQRDDTEAGGRVDRKSDDRIELDGVHLVAVQRSGGWHVSALYSLAEQIRQTGDPVRPVPNFGSGIAAKGAADPETAVRDAVTAATKFDVRRLIELTPPDEMAMLHDYGPLLVDAAADSSDGEPSNFTVTDLKLTTEDGPDGTKVVTARSYKLAMDDTYERFEVVFDGKCTSTKFTYTDPDPTWINGEPRTTKVCQDAGVVDDFATVGFFLPIYGGMNRLQVITEEHDGQWYISPTRSIIESALGGVRDISPDEAKRTARWWAGDFWLSQPDAFWKACGVAEPSVDATSLAGDRALEECYEKLPEDYSGPFYGGGIFRSGG